MRRNVRKKKVVSTISGLRSLDYSLIAKESNLGGTSFSPFMDLNNGRSPGTQSQCATNELC